MQRIRTIAMMLMLLSMSACSRGINAGGKTLKDNGGTAFVVMALMLILLVVTMWFFLGRED